MHQHSSESIAVIAAKAAPPVTVLTAAAAGVDWQQIVWQLTAAYLAVQLGLLLWDRLVKPNLRKREP